MKAVTVGLDDLAELRTLMAQPSLLPSAVAFVDELVNRATQPPPIVGHRVRIAQFGWVVSRPATRVDEVQVGFRLPWVEIDGHRFDAVISAHVAVDDGAATVPQLTLDVIGPVSIVYVDSDGTPLPGDQIELLDLGPVEHIDFDADTGRPRGGDASEVDDHG